MRRRSLAMWGAAVALMAAGPALAADVVTSTIKFESNLWGLNGDTVRQPNVPEVQKVAAPAITVTDMVTVTPNKNAVTRIANFPADFGGGATITVSKTTMGATLLQPNPTNRFDPFTAILVNEIHNQAGTAMLNTGPDKWTAEIPVNISTDICLDKVDSGGICIFVASIELPGAVGISGGNATFTGLVALLSIPIDGTLFGDKFTEGRVTVMKSIITGRRFGDPAGSPTMFKTFTFTSTGSRTADKLVLVTPIVVDAFVGVGPNRIPAPIIGFARSTSTGEARFKVPEPGVLLLSASLLALAGLARRRIRTA